MSCASVIFAIKLCGEGGGAGAQAGIAGCEWGGGEGQRTDDDHDCDEKLEVVVRETGLDDAVYAGADVGLICLFDGNLNAQLKLWKQVYALMVVGLQVVGVP